MNAEKPWFESLIACLPDGVALVTADFRVLWASPRLAEMLGNPPAMKGLALDDILADPAAVREALAWCAQRESRVEREVALRRTDGTTLPCLLSAAPCRAEVHARWSICVRDATESAELRRKLDERERSHSFLKAGTTNQIVRTDENFLILWSNEAASAMLPAGSMLADRLAPDGLAALHSLRDNTAPVETRHPVRLGFAAPSTAAAQGIVRVIRDDAGAFAGITLILSNDADAEQLRRFSERLGLSPREAEVVDYLFQGYTNLNIASILGLSESGVKFHIRNVFARAKVTSRTELMALCLGNSNAP